MPAERREGRIVKACAHAEADHHPGREIDGEGRRRGQERQAASQHHGADREDRPAAMGLNNATDAWRDVSGALIPPSQSMFRGRV